MSRKPVVFLSALALATLGLAACGGDPEGEETAPATASEEAAEQENGEDPQQEEQDEQEEQASEETDSADTGTEEYADEDGDEDASDTGEGTDAAEDDAAADEGGAADPGPAPEGAVIPADALSEPPQTIGGFTLMEGSGPAHIYSDEDSGAMVSLDTNVLGSPYETLVESIETDNTPAGTGSCGTNEAGSSITCYQQTADGVITLTAIPEEISLEDMAVFVNQYAEQAGAA